MTAFRFRDPQLARMAAVAARVEATMHTDECAECDEEDFAAQHLGSTAAGSTDKPWDGSAARFSDDQYKRAAAACDPGTGTEDGPTVKAGCFLPHHEPDGTTNVNGVHAAAQRASSLKGHDSGAVGKAKAHLRSHYSKLKEDPPDSIAASAETRAEFDRLMGEIAQALGVDQERSGPAPLEEMFANLHEKFSGNHSHAHSPYGSQGGDETHEHSHTHAGDNLHNHSHADASTDPVAASAGGRRPEGGPQSFRTEAPPDRAGRWESILAGLAFVAGAEPGRDPDPFLGAPWAVKQDGNKWYVLAAPGVMQADGGWQTAAPSYTDALAVIMEHLSQDNRPVLDQGWKAEMAYEGVSTGDGRFIEPGAIEYRNCPLPLMLQTETEPGHMGAVLAGAIMQTGKIGQIAIGAGDFDATDAGRQALQIILARNRFGVSIDVADADGAPICETHGTDTDQCDFDCDWELHFTLIRVMGLTMTPFPAFEDAYIELAVQPDTGQAQTASGTPTAFTTTATGTVQVGGGGGGRATLTAAGNVKKARVSPPAGYFERPDDWKDLLIRQPSGGYAVPLTVEEPDEHGFRRVYGSVADKRTCHTGIPGRCQTAPMSRDGKYPGFNLKPIMTAEGEMVNIGHITMGCGHASTTMRLSPDQVRAHYDGAPGAVSMAWAHAGQDENGPWIAGIINPARTEEEIEQFAMMSISGDWRKEWPGRGYDMFAVLAGVPVPGFPIAASAALVAAGIHLPSGPFLPAEPCFEMDDDGEPLALVAMGVVRQPMPWDREIMALRKDRDSMAARLEQAEKMLQPLRPIIAQVLTARLDGLDPLAAFSAPTAQDATITSLLTKAVTALHAVMAAQAGDPDNGDDPDDAAVTAHLTAAKNALDEAALAQAKDAAEPANA